MRYALLAAVATALLSTSAFAQDSSYSAQHQNRRAYAPAAEPNSPVRSAFPSDQMDRDHRGPRPITEEDRLFLMQGDRGIGNG